MSHFILRWFHEIAESHGIDRITYLTENESVDQATRDDMIAHVRSHYITPDRIAGLLTKFGYDAASRELRTKLPTQKRARSGELGEILISEFLNSQTGPQVVVKRLRWKDGRESALRGDDILACSSDAPTSLHIIKGECKSAQSLTQATIDEAVKKLNENEGRPSAHTLAFVTEQLSAFNPALADIIDQSQYGEGVVTQVDHLLGVLTQHKPKQLFPKLLKRTRLGSISRHLVALVLKRHGKTVDSVYASASSNVKQSDTII